MVKRVLNIYIDQTGVGTLTTSTKIPKQTLKLTSVSWRFNATADATNAKVLFVNFDFLTSGCGAYNNTQGLFTGDTNNINGTIMVGVSSATDTISISQYYDMQDDIDGEIIYRLTSCGTLANLHNLILSFEYEDE